MVYINTTRDQEINKEIVDKIVEELLYYSKTFRTEFNKEAILALGRIGWATKEHPEILSMLFEILDDCTLVTVKEAALEAILDITQELEGNALKKVIDLLTERYLPAYPQLFSALGKIGRSLEPDNIRQWENLKAGIVEA